MFRPFQEEHDQFRKTARAFAEKELAPYADEWEESGCFPNHVFKRAGELGILGAHFPEAHGGGGIGDVVHHQAAAVRVDEDRHDLVGDVRALEH